MADEAKPPARLTGDKRRRHRRFAGAQQDVRRVADGGQLYQALQASNPLGLPQVAADGEPAGATDPPRHRELVAAVLDSVGVLIVVLDRAGQVIQFNSACERLSGYSYAEVAGLPIWEVCLPAEEQAPIKLIVAELLSGRHSNGYECTWIAKDGRRRRIAWTSTTLEGEAGSVHYVISTGVDITLRTRAEMELQERLEFERRISTILEEFVERPLSELPAAVDRALESVAGFLGADCGLLFQFSEDFTRLAATRAWWHKRVGGNRPRWVTQPSSDLPWIMRQVLNDEIVVIPLVEELTSEAAADKAVLRQYGLQSLIVVPLMIGGSALGAICFGTLIDRRSWSEPAVARLRFVAEIFANALQRQRTEEVIRQSEVRFERLAEQVRVAAWNSDPRRERFTYAGPHADAIFGHPLAAVLRTGFWAENLHPDDRQRTIEDCVRLSAGEDSFELEYRMQTADGRTVWLHDIISVVRDERGPVALNGLMVDISGRWRAEEEARERVAATARLALLTPRARQVMQEVVNGKSNKAIARELGISVKTVEMHRSKLMKKLNLTSVAELVRLDMLARQS